MDKHLESLELAIIILSYYGNLKVSKGLMTQLKHKSRKLWLKNEVNWIVYFRKYSGYQAEESSVIPSSGILGKLMAIGNEIYMKTLKISLITSRDFEIFKKFLKVLSHPQHLTIKSIAMPDTSALSYSLTKSIISTLESQLGLTHQSLEDYYIGNVSYKIMLLNFISKEDLEQDVENPVSRLRILFSPDRVVEYDNTLFISGEVDDISYLRKIKED